MAIWVIILVVVFVAIVFLAYYNKFVVLKQRIDNSRSQIDVQMKKRADLIPNLVSTVKGYAKHERTVFNEVTKARTDFMKAKNFDSKVKANSEIQSALKGVFAVAENYPELKASANFLQLQQETASIEDKIAYARQFYNDSIMDYNNTTKKVPGKWFANLFKVKEVKYLEIPEEEKVVPAIKF
jgi:LemA protein